MNDRRAVVRRQEARVEYSGQVKAYRVDERLGDPRLVELTIASADDLSAGGIKLETSSDVMVSDHVATVFSFGGSSYRVMGQVVWTRYLPNHICQFGLRFESLSMPLRRQLRMAINAGRPREDGGGRRRRRANA